MGKVRVEAGHEVKIGLADNGTVGFRAIFLERRMFTNSEGGGSLTVHLGVVTAAVEENPGFGPIIHLVAVDCYVVAPLRGDDACR